MLISFNFTLYFCPIFGLFIVIFKIILSLNWFYRFIYNIMIGGLFLRSLVLCFKPTSDWAVETFLLMRSEAHEL